MHEVLVNRLGGLGLPRKSVVRLTDRPDMTLDVYRGRKTTMQQQQHVYDHSVTDCMRYVFYVWKGTDVQSSHLVCAVVLGAEPAL